MVMYGRSPNHDPRGWSTRITRTLLRRTRTAVYCSAESVGLGFRPLLDAGVVHGTMQRPAIRQQPSGALTVHTTSITTATCGVMV